MNVKKFAALTAATSGLVIAGAGAAMADSSSTATAGEVSHSPGVLSGNNVQVPVNIPVNLCNNQVNVIAVLDFVAGNSCHN